MARFIDFYKNTKSGRGSQLWVGDQIMERLFGGLKTGEGSVHKKAATPPKITDFFK